MATSCGPAACAVVVQDDGDLRPVQYCAESLRVLLAELVHGGVCAHARLAISTQRSLSSLLLLLHLCSSGRRRKAFG